MDMQSPWLWSKCLGTRADTSQGTGATLVAKFKASTLYSGTGTSKNRAFTGPFGGCTWYRVTCSSPKLPSVLCRSALWVSWGRTLTQFPAIHTAIVNGGDWLWSPANIKGANKDAKIYVRRSTTLHNLLFCVHTLCMNYVTSTFLLVSSSVRSKQLLCFVQGQGQKREQKHTTKNFVGFHNHSLY